MKFSLKKIYGSVEIKVLSLGVVLLVVYIFTMPKDQKKEEELKDVSIDIEIDKSLQELFEKKNQAVLNKDTKTLKAIYDVESKLGQWGYEHELKKIKHLENWSNKQGVEFTQITPKIVVKKIKENNGKISAYLLSSTEYRYKYKEEEEINISRVGSYHVIDLKDQDGSLKILKEWYGDPFADSMNVDQIEDEGINSFIASQVKKEEITLSEKRKKAVEYAHIYSGGASLEEFGFKYNSEYKDYNGQGGDCTNFISQVLLAGGFKKDQAWNYNSNGASKAWVNAQGFKEYLLYSGRGSLLARGDYKEVYKEAYKLLPGDIISYEKNGKVAHTALVTDLDSKGYPLVTCHNADRNNVPWDVGFNGKGIRFYLIKMNY